MKVTSCASVGKYGNGTQLQRHLPNQYIDNGSNPTPNGPLFFKVSANPLCCTCEGDGLMVEKGTTDWHPCFDCGTLLCYGCSHATRIERDKSVWCDRLKKKHDPTMICDFHKRR